MSKEELSIMHACVCMSVYTVYIAYLLFMSQEHIQNIALSFFFENIHLEKLLTCLSALSLSVPAQVPFCDPTVGPVQ